MVAGFQPGENQNPLPRAAGRFDHHPPLAAPGGPAPLGWNNPPTPRWNASESAIIARRCPHDISSTIRHQKGRHPCGGNGLKSTLRGFSNGLSLRQSRSRRSHSIRQSAAEPAGRSPEVKKHHQPEWPLQKCGYPYSPGSNRVDNGGPGRVGASGCPA